MDDYLTNTVQQAREIIRRLLGREIDAEAFCAAYDVLWLRFRDAAGTLRHAWADPYDPETVAAHLRDELTSEDLGRTYGQLSGLPAILKCCEFMDLVHEACRAFRPTPQQPGEIDATRLRKVVEQALANHDMSC